MLKNLFLCFQWLISLRDRQLHGNTPQKQISTPESVLIT